MMNREKDIISHIIPYMYMNVYGTLQKTEKTKYNNSQVTIPGMLLHKTLFFTGCFKEFFFSFKNFPVSRWLLSL